MKNYYMIGILLLFGACASETMKNDRQLVQQIGAEEMAGGVREEVVAYIKGKYSCYEGPQSKSFDMPLVTAGTEIEAYQLYILPYYIFDNNQFNENPSEENLLACIKPVSAINVLAERDGRIDARFLLDEKEGDGHWMKMMGSDSYGRVIGWLKDSLKNGDISDFKIFGQGYGLRELVTYKKNGENCFFRITGEPYTATQMCTYFVKEHGIALENAEFLKNNPDFLGK